MDPTWLKKQQGVCQVWQMTEETYERFYIIDEMQYSHCQRGSVVACGSGVLQAIATVKWKDEHLAEHSMLSA